MEGVSIRLREKKEIDNNVIHKESTSYKDSLRSFNAVKSEVKDRKRR
jgi:hypothetical protein